MAGDGAETDECGTDEREGFGKGLKEAGVGFLSVTSDTFEESGSSGGENRKVIPVFVVFLSPYTYQSNRQDDLYVPSNSPSID
jgi:hypothetical protein